MYRAIKWRILGRFTKIKKNGRKKLFYDLEKIWPKFHILRFWQVVFSVGFAILTEAYLLKEKTYGHIREHIHAFHIYGELE